MISLLAGRGIAGIGAAGLVSVIRIILTDSGSLNEDNIMNAVLIVFYTIGFSTGYEAFHPYSKREMLIRGPLQASGWWGTP